jgi:hypothetical protein
VRRVRQSARGVGEDAGARPRRAFEAAAISKQLNNY